MTTAANRGVMKVLPGMPATDGAGVRMTRVIATEQLDYFDPFLLLDEFRSDDPGDYIAGFPDHPHRGFETVTYMLAGAMKHGDNKGNTGLLGPGSVQWMTAGRGIIHSEMPQQEDGLMWGFQLWVNLPADQKMVEPRYQDISAADVPERVEKLLAERRELERELEKLRAEQRGAASSDLTENVKELAGIKLVAARVDGVEGQDLRTMVDELRDKLRSGVVLLASEKKGRVTLALGVTPDLTERFRAGDLVREVARVVGGKGGGRADFAQAGGKDASKLAEAFERLEALIAEG